MTDTASTLVVLIDADDVKYVFAGWPDQICLAACLTRDGDCSLVVFRRDERSIIPVRLMHLFQVESDDICFVPRVHGFPTKQFRYSDERRLMALVASDPAILDDAIDYAVNYTYALEEGLDPAVVLGLEPSAEPHVREQLRHMAVPRTRVGQEVPANRELSPLLPNFLRKSAEQSRRPRFASVRKVKISMLAPQA